MSDSLSLVLFSGTADKLHAAATLAAGGAYLAIMWPLTLREPLGIYVRPRLATLRRLVLNAAGSRVPDA